MTTVEDRISHLPKSLILHILSFLPTKHAIQTCVLSTKWRYLWVSIPTLDLDDLWFPSQMHSRKKRKVDAAVVVKPTFKDFVDKVLMLRDGSDLLKLCLCLRRWNEVYPVDTWIRYAIWHNVRELDLYLDQLFQFKFPHYVFTSRSLQVLKLSGTTLQLPAGTDFQSLQVLELSNVTLQLPAGTGFQSLKTLHLFEVCVLAGQDMNFEFLSHCPLLEYLEIVECDPKGMNILGLKLKTLILRFCSSDIKIRVTAPSLQTFEYMGYVPKDFDGENLFSLAHALLHLVEGTSNYLDSPTESMEEPRESMEEPKENMEEKQRICVSKLIQWTSNAESITLYISSLMLLSFECPVDHLKEVKIRDFGGLEDELEVLKFLLQRAKILERMIFFTSDHGWSDSQKQMVVRKLMAFPRASSCITIIFL